MYHNRYLEEMRETCRETGSMNWFRLQSTKYETVRKTEENEYKDEIFADVDPGINWYLLKSPPRCKPGAVQKGKSL